MEEQVQVAEEVQEVKELPFHHIYVTVGHPLNPTAVREMVVVKVIDGKSEREAAIKLRNEFAKDPTSLGFIKGIQFKGQDLYYAIYHMYAQGHPDEWSKNYEWRRR